MNVCYSKERIFYSVIFGLNYGYKPCCIKHFNVLTINLELSGGVPPSGLVTCPTCEKTLSNSEIIESINSNRLVDYPYSENIFEQTSIPTLIRNVDTKIVDSLVSEIVDTVDNIIFETRSRTVAC